MNHHPVPRHNRIQQECVQFLQASGEPVSEAVQALISYFFSTDHHVRLADFEKYAQEKKLSIGREQILRVLRLMVRNGFAQQKCFDGLTTVYEHLHLNEHHDHMYCLGCGAIIEFHQPEIEQLQAQVAAVSGFHIFTHKLQLLGMCRTCFATGASRRVSLDTVAQGGRFRISEVEGRGQGMQRRLGELGFQPGQEGEVLTNHRGRIVVSMGGGRIALAPAHSQRILVVLLN